MMVCQRKFVDQLLMVSGLLLVLAGGFGCSGEDPDELFQKGVEAIAAENPEEAIIWFKKALQLDHEMPLAHYRLGQIYHQKGNAKVAYGQLYRAVQLDPELKEARKELIFLLVENRDLDQIVSTCEDYLKINGDDEEVYLILGNSLAYQKKFDEAAAILKSASEKYPENETILINLARIHVINGAVEVGRTMLENLVKESPANIDARISLSEVYGVIGRYDLTLLTLESLKKDFPEDTRSYQLLAQLALKKNHPEEAMTVLSEAESKGVHDSGIFRMQAMILHRDGNKEEALNYFKKAVDSATEESRSLNQMILADYYSYLKKYKEAQQILETVISEDSSKKKLKSRVVELFLLQGEFEQAKSSVDALLEEDSGDARGHYLKGLMMMREKDVAAARKQFSKAQELAPDAAENQFMYGLTFVDESQDISITEISEAVKKNPNLLKARMALAELCAKKGDFQASLEELDRIIEKQPHEKRARVLRISVLLKMSRPEMALADAQYLVENEPEVSWHRFRLAEIYFFTKEYDKALPLYLTLQEEKPDSVQVLNRIISIHMLNSEQDKALEIVDTFLVKYPDSSGAVLTKAKIYLSQGYLELAENVLLAEVEKGRDVASLLMLAGLYQTKKDNDQVVYYYKKALEILPGNVSVLMNLADFYLKNEMYRQSIEVYEEVLEQKSDFLAAMNNLAFLYTEVGGNQDRALELAVTAAKALPENPDVADTLGWIYVVRQSYTQAEPYLKQALEARPDNPTILYHMGMLRLGQQRFDDAKVLLTKASQQEISATELAKVDEALSLLQERQGGMEKAVAVYESGDVTQATELFEELLASGYFNSEVAANLAILYVERGGESEKAMELALKAYDSQPENALVLDALGWVYFHRGSLLLAKQYIEKSIEQDVGYGRAHVHLAAIYLKKGDIEAARDSLKAAETMELATIDKLKLKKILANTN